MGLVNYCCDMWKSLLHTLETITNLTSNKVKFQWVYFEQNPFKDIKRIVARKKH